MSDVKVVNFKRTEVTAMSKVEAIEKIEKDFYHIQGDATIKYRAWLAQQVNGVTDRDIKVFMLDYLATKGKNCPGVGYIICLDSAHADTREHPYRIDHIKNEDGPRRTKKVLVWVDEETGTEVARAQGTKAEASKVIKDLYKTGNYRGNARCEIHYDVVEGNPVVMKSTYTPSKNAKMGHWVAFGLEAC